MFIELLTDANLPSTYQLKSAMPKEMFLYIKTSTAPVWPDSENYSITLYLVTLSKEIDCGRKNGE